MPYTGTVGKFHPHIFFAFFGKIKIFVNLLYSGICRFSTLSIFLKKRRKICKERLSQQSPKDMIVVWRLDRLGRSLKHLIDWFNELERKDIEFQSLREKIDTSSPTGKLVFHLFGALAEFERNLIQERTQAGLTAARARGRLGGRPKSLDTAKRSLVLKLYKGLLGKSLFAGFAAVFAKNQEL